MPPDKSAYLKIIFHFSKKKPLCASVGTQKKRLNESVLLKHKTHTVIVLKMLKFFWLS